MLIDDIGGQPAAPRDGVRCGRHVERSPEIDDRDVFSGVEPPLERFGRDACRPEPTQEQVAAPVLDQDVPGERCRDEETEHVPERGGSGRNTPVPPRTRRRAAA